MLVSTKGRYALRVMVAPGRAPGGRPHSPQRDRRARDFENISRTSWLRSYVPTCSSVCVARAAAGGLAAPARAVHGGRDLAPDRGQPGAGRMPVFWRSKWLFAFDECRPTLDVWKNLDKLINDYLDGVTLDQLVAPQPWLRLRHLAPPAIGGRGRNGRFSRPLRLDK